MVCDWETVTPTVTSKMSALLPSCCLVRTGRLQTVSCCSARGKSRLHHCADGKSTLGVIDFASQKMTGLFTLQISSPAPSFLPPRHSRGGSGFVDENRLFGGAKATNIECRITEFRWIPMDAPQPRQIFHPVGANNGMCVAIIFEAFAVGRSIVPRRDKLHEQADGYPSRRPEQKGRTDAPASFATRLLVSGSGGEKGWSD